MAKAVLRVLQTGLMTLVVGLPQPGRQRYGVAPGGAMDTASLRLANLLVRNAPDAPALEITLAGPTLRLLSDCLLAITGAIFDVGLDGADIAPYHAFHAPAGSELAFRRRRTGARAYLAVAGGIVTNTEKVTPVPLVKGDILFGNGAPDSGPHLHLPQSEMAFISHPAYLGILPGPQWDRLSGPARQLLTSEEYEVSLESNRIGIRLGGPKLGFAAGAGADILSEPAPLGTIQVPHSGQPIILMVDRPTTGGYAKVATVTTADIPGAAQLAPGDRVRFEITDMETARKAANDRETGLRLLERMATWPGI